MQTLTIDGHQIQIFQTYDGQELFVTKDGEKVYSCRMSKGADAIARAKQFIGALEVLTETQTIGLALSRGEKEFTKTYNSIHGGHDRAFRAKVKAENELRLNDTIRFERGVLKFTSRFSGKDYIVTRHGCSFNCVADKTPHYHRALYELCAAKEMVTPFSQPITALKVAA